MFRNALSSLLVLGLLASLPQDAVADKETSAIHYKKAKKKYNLGEFEEAIELFKKAYDEHEAPAYLYNIAQAYRQLNNCQRALFFYERFLAEKPGSSQEETIKGYVANLKEECGDDASAVGSLNEVDEPAAKPPVEQGLPAEAKKPPTEPEPPVEPPVVQPKPPETPRGPLLRFGADAGLAKISMGDVVTPVSPTLRLGAAYIHDLGAIELRAGARLQLSSMAYETTDSDATMRFTSYSAVIGASYAISPELRVGGDLALGMLGYSALESGNPFIDGGAEADGASNLAFSVDAEIEYALSDSLGVSGAAGYGSSGVGDEFASDITSIGTLSLLGGVRYRW